MTNKEKKESKEESKTVVSPILGMAGMISFKFSTWVCLLVGKLHSKIYSIWIRDHEAMYA